MSNTILITQYIMIFIILILLLVLIFKQPNNDSQNKTALKDKKQLQKQIEQLQTEIANKDKLYKNAIIPKFKERQKVWAINDKKIVYGEIKEIEYNSYYGYCTYYIPEIQKLRIKESELFASPREIKK
ncbi:MAG: hypothetical protein EOL97_14495 [Spirochaetia bacterium]|nr:hypothetical protein [Spirochaetia bacterium]